ncbi:hypothetical protein Slin14017_G100610 [Septoria linicola]|nr:hypothetical protein Slin14017_G100610 [Septoria linicola]
MSDTDSTDASSGVAFMNLVASVAVDFRVDPKLAKDMLAFAEKYLSRSGLKPIDIPQGIIDALAMTCELQYELGELYRARSPQCLRTSTERHICDWRT